MLRPVLEAGQGKPVRRAKVAIDGFALARLIAACALFIAVLRWPYTYYTVLRWTVCIVAVFGAFRAFDMGRKPWAWIFVALAVLFNPITPLYFARKTWNLLDPLAAITLLLSIPVLRTGRAAPPYDC
jgi:hypothetical protein